MPYNTAALAVFSVYANVIRYNQCMFQHNSVTIQRFLCLITFQKSVTSGRCFAYRIIVYLWLVAIYEISNGKWNKM